MKDVLLIIVGTIIGIVITALFHPLSRWLERVSRRLWRTSPIYVHIDSDPSIIWAGYPPWVGSSVWLPSIPSEGPPESCLDWRSWALKAGGSDGQQSTLRITIQAREDVALVIETVSVRQNNVIDSAEVGGCFLTCQTAGAAISPRRIEVQLDWGRGAATATWIDQDGSPTTAPQLSLSAGEFEQFHIWAKTEQGRHEWWLELLLIVEGRRVVVPIHQEHNGSFVTIGCRGLPQLSWQNGQWESSEEPPS